MSDSLRLELSNFMVHSKFENTFETGVTLVCGYNNSGKSTLVRAIKLMIEGRMLDSHIQNGTESASILMDWNGMQANANRSKGKASYRLNDGTTILKIGTQTFSQVFTEYPLKPVSVGSIVYNPHVISQRKEPLIGEVNLFEFFSGLFLNSNAVQNSIEVVTDKIKEIRGLAKMNDQFIDYTEKEITDGLSDYISFDDLKKELKELKDHKKSCEYNRELIIKRDKIHKNLLAKELYKSEIPSEIEYSECKVEFDKTKQRLRILESVDKERFLLDRIDSIIDHAYQFLDHYEYYNSQVLEIEVFKTEYSEINYTIQDICKELERLKHTDDLRCPKCGRDFDNKEEGMLHREDKIKELNERLDMLINKRGEVKARLDELVEKSDFRNQGDICSYLESLLEKVVKMLKED